MATRPIRVWSGTAWEDVAIAPYDSGEFLSAATASATYLRQDTASATYIADSIVNAKGDLITATANDTPNILTAGSNGQMLMADSSATAGLRYVDPPANRNLIINGAMQVAQRGTSVASITSNGYYTADRWALQATTLGTWTQTVETDAPTGSGLNKSVKMLCTTAKTSPAAGDFMRFDQYLEGQDVQRVKKGTASAEQLTLSFWVKSNVTGTYVAELVDTDNTRQVSASYTVSSSATWERKTITFPADTTGAFDNNNDVSLRLCFYLGAGTTFTSGTLNTTWASTTNANRAVGVTNLAAATNNYWQITGVQLETGPVATPFEFEPYETTLRKCQRYYYRMNATSIYTAFTTTQPAESTTVCYGYTPYPVVMRAAPSSIDTNALIATDGANTYSTGTFALYSNGSGAHGGGIKYTHGSAALTQYRNYFICANNSTSAYLAFNAEL